MPRVPVDWRSSSRENYIKFCKKHPDIKVSFDEWKNIIYMFNENFRDYILETGDKGKLPLGFGEFAINKKKRKRIKVNPKTGKEYINLPVDWKRTKEKGKKIYIFNYHTEGYHFRWKWIKDKVRIKYGDLWWFKPSRVTSRTLAHYLKTDEKYQHLYKEWIK
jgi:nucleoid DNA-binding protein